MLDARYTLDHIDEVHQNLIDRNVAHLVPDLFRFAREEGGRREFLRSLEQLRRQQNDLSDQISESFKDRELRQTLIGQSKYLKQQIAAADQEVKKLTESTTAILERLPNMTHPDTPRGNTDAHHKVIKTVCHNPKDLEPREDPRDHLQIARDSIDLERAAKVSGSGFYFLKGGLVRLDLALQQYALDVLEENGFIPVMTPDLARNSILQGTGFAPKGDNSQIYSIQDHDLSLIGTSEITLAGMHAYEVLQEVELPIKYAGISHCFRTEAGAAGKASKGLYRVHQFNKVEMFVICTPEQSEQIHQDLLCIQERIFYAFGFPTRVLDICSGDLGGPAYRKYDIEAWMPSRNAYGEVTSTSNCTDYQARRLNIRYKPTDQDKGTRLVHTLNGTAIATSRAILALLENYQRQDNLAVTVPPFLQPYLNGMKSICHQP